MEVKPFIFFSSIHHINNKNFLQYFLKKRSLENNFTNLICSASRLKLLKIAVDLTEQKSVKEKTKKTKTKWERFENIMPISIFLMFVNKQ